MDRAGRLLEAMAIGGGQAVLLHNPSNMFYASGYTGEGLLLLTAKTRAIVTDFRYTEQAASQAPGFEVFMTTRDRDHNRVAADILREQGVGTVFYEDDFMTVRVAKAMEQAMEGMTFCPVDKAVEKLREVKDEGEIQAIAKACEVSCQGFEHILGFIREGLSEREIARELEHYMLTHGAHGLAFSTIVASGENGSLPHAIPGERAVRQGDMITLDFGAKVDGYCADMTRTVALGQPSDTMRHVYQVVFTAQQMAQDALAAGKSCKAIDAIARDYIASQGYGENFGHGLGHSLGIDIHENPRLSMLSGDTARENHVLTVEPGVYLPGIGGVRIENTCVVTEDGCRTLVSAPRELIIL